MSRMGRLSRCSCSLCFSSGSVVCCASFGAGRSDVRRIINTAVREGSFYAALAGFVILAAFPFYWMLITAFKTNSDLYDLNNIPFWFNDAPTLEHVEYLFTQTLFARWLFNSALIGICVVAITLLCALPAGY